MKKRLIAVTAAITVLILIIGCRSQKPPFMLNGQQVAIFVLSDRGIKGGMNEDSIKDRNKMGQFLEENLIELLKVEGYNAVLIKTHDQYIEGRSNYLVSLKINDMHLVRIPAFSPIPTFLWCQYDVSGMSGKLSLSYADDDSTTRDWTNSPRELNERLVKKINDRLVGKTN
jgi:hypothetical protein